MVFRAGGSCIDNLLTLKQVVEKKLERKMECICCLYVDSTKACDHMACGEIMGNIR